MGKEQSLVIIKPDGLLKSLTGNIITELSELKLKIVGAKVVKVSRELAEKHYADMKGRKPEHIIEGTIKYLMGEFHTDRVLALVYEGENAIEKIRKICGSTNPEEADPVSIRGKYGRINSKTGVFENGVHTSADETGAKRDIQLWFSPNELTSIVYPTKKIKIEKEEIVWK
jgi:nucleoside-diphosphate kinase